MKMSLRKIFVFIVFLNSFQFTFGQKFFVDSILNLKPILKAVRDGKEKYRLQIIYTEIKRNDNGKPSFKNYNYRVDSSSYFYCASLVKLPTSILALEKINSLADKGITKETICFTDSANTCQRSVKSDPSASNGYPSIGHYIKKMALVSDNFAFGRVYEFVGVDHLHDRLSELGFKNIRIIHRFDGGCSGPDNLITNPISFYDKDKKLLYRQEQVVSKRTYKNPIGTVKVGRAYINAKNKKVNEPKDFTYFNYMSLQDIHRLLQRLIFSEEYPENLRYKITKEDQEFLMNYLTLYPRESKDPVYDPKEFYDNNKKYFIYGDIGKNTIADTSLKITNIVGQSYGFLVDCAYITNKKENIEFMLSATLYVNEDGIINDGKYEYKTIGFPFLAELGRQIYDFEKSRK
jgi:hypothetical protein